ncbi:lytic murein transglycosylase [Candidatus Kaiserbacteria bacterium]|nr:lytic murein transglycosylase [Candidatus Kaiserbacteria bacterium]
MRTPGAAFFVVSLLLTGCFVLPVYTYAQTSLEQRAALQAQLDQIEKDIANNQGTLSTLQAERTTLERDIKILDNKIRIAQLQIKKSDTTLTQLKGNIIEKQQSIVQVDAKVARSEASLAQLLRRTREIDDVSLTQLALGESLEQFFQDIDDFQSIQKSLGESFIEMAALREELSGHKAALEDKEDEAQKVRQVQVLAKQAVLKDEKEKQAILSATKGQEKTYQQIIANKKKQAAAIRAALFGLRDSGAIPFGTAYDYAKKASSNTGVRPALILAILTQESNLGENTGSCYVRDLATGSGVGKNTGKAFAKVMKAPRDTEPFVTITQALGLDWTTTQVSCPQSIGYGGAMGPSQFIPSTWMLYKARLSSQTGVDFPDPWNAQTAILATGLLMKDNGAAEGTRTAERRAALKYFAGSNWNSRANAFYGDSVMELVDKIQAEIDILNQ